MQNSYIFVNGPMCAPRKIGYDRPWCCVCCFPRYHSVPKKSKWHYCLYHGLRTILEHNVSYMIWRQIVILLHTIPLQSRVRYGCSLKISPGSMSANNPSDLYENNFFKNILWSITGYCSFVQQRLTFIIALSFQWSPKSHRIVMRRCHLRTSKQTHKSYHQPKQRSICDCQQSCWNSLWCVGTDAVAIYKTVKEIMWK